AVGAYNAGFKKTPLQDARRLDYATDVHRIWIAIKQSKTRQTPAR
ncbi:lytic transglycosylase, partial [Salmonella enterica]|nr:lytic transglycosylase [Salmonella enterica]